MVIAGVDDALSTLPHKTKIVAETAEQIVCLVKFVLSLWAHKASANVYQCFAPPLVSCFHTSREKNNSENCFPVK